MNNIIKEASRAPCERKSKPEEERIYSPVGRNEHQSHRDLRVKVCVHGVTHTDVGSQELDIMIPYLFILLICCAMSTSACNLRPINRFSPIRTLTCYVLPGHQGQYKEVTEQLKVPSYPHCIQRAESHLCFILVPAIFQTCSESKTELRQAVKVHLQMSNSSVYFSRCHHRHIIRELFPSHVKSYLTTQDDAFLSPFVKSEI